MILHISIGASSPAEISLWNTMLKEERKHLQNYHAVCTNPVASTQRAITECFGTLAKQIVVLKAIETTFAKNTHLTRDGCIEIPEF